MVSGIYSITNKINGKIYIGQSNNVFSRLNNHKSRLEHNQHHNPHLQSAWNKYGSDAFEFELMMACKLRYLDRFEKLQIKIHNSTNSNNGYNLESGGNKYKSLSDETKQRIREANLGKKLSEDTKNKISESLKGRPSPMLYKNHSMETRMKMSKSHYGKESPQKGKSRRISSNIKTSESMNTTGYFRVTKRYNPRYKQGFFWQYQYYDENHKRRTLCNVDLNKLKEDVLYFGLEWREINGSTNTS